MTGARPEDALLAAGVPILIPDTCVLLDLVRAPIRDAFSEADGQTALSLLELAEAGAISVAIPDKVRSEYEENVGRVQEETKEALTRTTEALERMLRRLTSIGGEHAFQAPAVAPFAVHGRTLAERFLARAVPFDGGDEERLKAVNRMARAIRPAQKGKDSLGDCLITENCLSLTRRLREAGHAKPILFVSSNVADYCVTPSKLAPPLDEEFQDADIAFACRWAAAYWLARAAGAGR
jgi:hypothetical protein